MIVDSNVIFETISSLQCAKRFRLRRTFTMIRNSPESRDIYSVRCIQGKFNVSDTLTTLKVELFRRLYRMTSSGFHKTMTADNKILRSEVWI